jgi:sulfoquinovosidase
VVQKYNILKENQVPIAAVWMQDWVGTKEFPEGVRLMWNWKLNREFYPNWDEMIANWTQDGTKAMIYINPYFANLTDASITRNLFLEGDALGYFIKNKQNTTYLIKSVSIEFAMIDLTNPNARIWMKSIIKDNLIAEG